MTESNVTNGGRPVPYRSWPESYVPGTLEPLGNVWDRTGGTGNGIDIDVDLTVGKIIAVSVDVGVSL